VPISTTSAGAGAAGDSGSDVGRHADDRAGAGIRNDSDCSRPSWWSWAACARASRPGSSLGGVSVYLAEIATPGHKGFYVSWQSGSQQVAVVFAGVLGYTLSNLLAPEALVAWGWRIPLLIGCLIIPFIFLIRRTLEETPEFAARKHHPTPSEVYAGMLGHARLIVTGVAMVLMTTVSFYNHHGVHPDVRQRNSHGSPRAMRSWSPCAWGCRICSGCPSWGRCRIGSGVARC